MTLLSTFIIAVALAMDAFAVSIGVGITLKKISARQTFRLSWHFGLFQAFMPVIGWILGATVRQAVESYDHWVAFILLALVGGNMVRSALQPEDKDESSPKDPTKGMTMVMLSIATSIDALAIGFSLSILKISIFFPVIVIGIVAGAFTIVGLHLGKRIGSYPKLNTSMEIMGGMVLWCIGLHILYEHGVFQFLLS